MREVTCPRGELPQPTPFSPGLFSAPVQPGLWDPWTYSKTAQPGPGDRGPPITSESRRFRALAHCVCRKDTNSVGHPPLGLSLSSRSHTCGPNTPRSLLGPLLCREVGRAPGASESLILLGISSRRTRDPACPCLGSRFSCGSHRNPLLFYRLLLGLLEVTVLKPGSF